MATRIVSWGGNEHVTALSPSPSKAPSIVSVDSMLPEKLSAPQNTPIADDSGAKHMSSQAIEPSRTRTSWTPSMCPWVDATDNSFIRHHKYFFEDGNVAFLVENILYCVHRYFFSRDSIYFSTRFAELNIRDHEALPTIISLGDIERKDFDAFLSVLYPGNFEENDLSYEEWKSVLHLSTRWGFASLRKWALSSIEPPTPHDRLLLARTYSFNDWVVPALSALCERTTPLTLSEARQMSIEDVVLVSTVREHIRGCMLQVDSAEILLRVEAEQLIALGSNIPAHLRFAPHFPNSEAPSLMDPKRATKEDDRDAHESDDECSAEEEAPGDICVRTGEPSQLMKNSREEVEAGAAAWMSKNARNGTEEVAAKRAEEERVAKRAEERLVARQRAADKAAKAAWRGLNWAGFPKADGPGRRVSLEGDQRSRSGDTAGGPSK